MKNRSIKTAVVIPAISVLIAGVIAMVAVVGLNASASTTDLTNRIVDARVNEYTNKFASISIEGYSMVSALTPVVDTLAQTSADPRVRIVETLSNALLSNSAIMGVWSAWEPDALDGLDADYAGTGWYDETGRFLPSITRNESGGAAVEVLVGYDDPVAGEFYQGAKTTLKPYITDPYEYTSANGVTSILYSIAIPILRDGAAVGAVGMDINLDNISQAMNAGSILDDGNLSVISPGGLFTSSQTQALVLKSYKSIWLGEFSSDIDEVLKNGGTFTGVGYSDVLSTDVRVTITGVLIGDTGKYWGICGLVPQKNVTAASDQIVLLIICVGAALIVLTALTIYTVVSRSLRKLPVITEMGGRLAKGDIEIDGLDNGSSPTKNEVILLERAFAGITRSIREQAGVMTAIAGGDYTVDIPIRSEADVMNKAVALMLKSTNETLSQISSSTNQVAVGARQIADGAQALAQGSTEQAATVQELSASVTEIAHETSDSTEMASRSARLAGEIMKNAETGSRQMNEMTAAVSEINQASQNIGNVMKVIDDIAFQTNILALNAAVEAARAGQHGKGFAVVAEEVRNLAAKSSEAAKDTGSLIQNSIEKAALGARIAAETAASLNEIVAGINESAKIADDIAKLSQRQSNSIGQVNEGIDQVAKVVQMNSATAEQSAAASQEMSMMSTTLENLLAQFRLRGSVNADAGGKPAPGIRGGATGFAMK